jgi:hypothetical protein
MEYLIGQDFALKVNRGAMLKDAEGSPRMNKRRDQYGK